MPAETKLPTALKQFALAVLRRIPFAEAIYAKLRNSILAAAREDIRTAEARLQAGLDRMGIEFDARMNAGLDGLRAESDARMKAAMEGQRAEFDGLQRRLVSVERIFDRIQLLETTVFQTFSGHDSNGDIDILITVVMPTYNRGHCISDAIDSIVAQSFRNWELIIVDDGSDDSTASVVSPYLSDDRIRYVVQPHAGHSIARNHALRLARGSVVAYLDSDNIWYPDFLNAVADEFAANPTVDFVYGALVSRHHGDELGPVVWFEFDRDELLRQNYVDMNAIAHRFALIGQFGNFDESLERLADWDIALRYTVHAPARRIPVLAARYRVRDDARVSETVPYGPAHFNIRRKWLSSRSDPGLRVLYIVWQYPQLSETYIEAEILGLQRLGVHVEVWRQAMPASFHESSVRIHEGSIAEAIDAAKPDIVHVHWLTFGLTQEAHLQDTGIPVTFRLHGFEVTSDTLNELLKRRWVASIYAFPHQLELAGVADARVKAVKSVFDTTLFKPNKSKDHRLVIRTVAGLPSKDIPFFFDLAEQLPDFRFILAVVTCYNWEHYPDELRELHRQKNSRVDLRFDVPREEIASLVGSAGIYVHTALRPGQNGATPIGMPISIAEAMATGAYVLVPDLPQLQSYVGGAGSGYSDLAGAARAIADTAGWSDDKWHETWCGSIDRAFLHHADETVLFDILEDWGRIVACSGKIARDGR